MRVTYDLTDETRKVLTDNVKAIALEMDVNESYLYQILSSVECDSFAKYRRLYAACVRAGADVTPWDASLSAIKTRKCREMTETQCLVQKIERDADGTSRLVDALRDGQIDEREREAIRAALQRERDSLDVLEAFLGEGTTVREFARKAVRGRK